jgi:hypothetical protein
MSAGTFRVEPILFCAPVFFVNDYWAEDVHSLDGVQRESPLDDKPRAEVEVSLDATLGEIFDVACEAWGIRPGVHLMEHYKSESDALAAQFQRFAFVQPIADRQRLATESYAWPETLPIAREDGMIEQKPGVDVTYRELLVASELGLIEGDIKRPYVDPVIPQGDLGPSIEAAKFALEVVRAAYAGVDDAWGYAEHTVRLIQAWGPGAKKTFEDTTDEAMRVGFWGGIGVGMWSWLKRRSKRDD